MEPKQRFTKIVSVSLVGTILGATFTTDEQLLAVVQDLGHAWISVVSSSTASAPIISGPGIVRLS